MDERRAVLGRVSGRVQGVAYRASLQREARAHRLTGWVRNLPDGRVEFLLQGPPAAVQSVLDWASHGPPFARVDAVESEDFPNPDLESFVIRYE